MFTLLVFLMKTNRILAFVVLGAAVASAHAVRSYAVTESGTFLSFEHSTPESPYYAMAISGLAPNEKIVGMDSRPSNGMLYGVGSFGNLYTLNTRTGTATPASLISTMLNGSKFGVDFNPVPDRLRITSTQSSNLRVNVETGVALIDGTLSYGTTTMPNIVASAYTNSFAGATSTQLFNIDSEIDALVLQNPPNDGTLGVVSYLNVDLDDRTSFDIYTRNGKDRAFVVVNLPGSNSSSIHNINLVTGALTFYGAFRGSDRVIAFCFDTRD